MDGSSLLEERWEIEQDGLLNVSSIHGKGGSVVLEGEQIVLEIDSVIDATGSIGGGEVLIGGDWQGGANEELRVFDDPYAIIQSKSVEMQDGARIDASAINNGDGGTVVLWSDVLNPDSFTTVLGEIYAKGGNFGGEGGRIETSGALAINQAQVSTLALRQYWNLATDPVISILQILLLNRILLVTQLSRVSLSVVIRIFIQHPLSMHLVPTVLLFRRVQKL